MKLYADLPGRRTAQILSDLFALGWVVLWVWAGRFVRDATLDLRKPAEGLTSAGGSFSQNMSGASEQLQRVPGIGDDLARPFTSASGTGQQLAQAGRDLGVAVDRLALVLGILIAAIPILVVCGLWLALRVRFVRRATAAQRFVDADADLDLFALRAMARQPMHKLAAISDDPAGAWRRRDPVTVRDLAVLELRASGLKPPGAAGTPARPRRSTPTPRA